jgi:hypothetical protein
MTFEAARRLLGREGVMRQSRDELVSYALINPCSPPQEIVVIIPST